MEVTATMLKIRNLIHLTHVIEDNDKRREAERFYLDVFAAQTFFDARPMPGLERDETLTLIGKTQLIPMAPVDEVSTTARTSDAMLPALWASRLRWRTRAQPARIWKAKDCIRLPRRASKMSSC